MIDEMRSWVTEALIGHDGYLAPSGFASSLPLYHTPLQRSFVLSVIDGSARPAPFRVPEGRSAYNELIRVVRRVSGDESAYWFYGTDPDNCLSLLAWMHQCDYGHALDSCLESFETTPAVQGGRSWLGLVGESRRWLLLHEYSPHNSFAITIHGAPEFCRAVADGVGVKSCRVLTITAKEADDESAAVSAPAAPWVFTGRSVHRFRKAD